MQAFGSSRALDLPLLPWKKQRENKFFGRGGNRARRECRSRCQLSGRLEVGLENQIQRLKVGDFT